MKLTFDSCISDPYDSGSVLSGKKEESNILQKLKKTLKPKR